MATVELTEEQKEKRFFNPSWFSNNDFGIRIQAYSTKDINIKKPRVQDLKDSIKQSGYDSREPIIVFTSKDANAHGIVGDGRNRLIACNMILIETGQLPNIKFVFEPVKDLVHAKLRQIFYESPHLLRKDSDEAGEHIVELYEDIKRMNPEMFGQRTIEETLLREGKFEKSNVTLISVIANRITKFEEKLERKRQEKISHSQPRKAAQVGEEVYDDWGEKRGTGPPISTAKPKILSRSFAAELETTCACGKKTNHGLNVNVFDDGTVGLELVN